MALASLVEDNASLQAQACQGDLVRRRAMLTSLLKRRVEGPEAFEEVCACYGVPMRQVPCAVVTFSLRHIARRTFMDAGQTDIPYDLIFFSLDNVLGEVLQASWLHIADECDGMMVCLLQPREGHAWDSLREDLQQIGDFFADSLRLTLGISVSGQGSSPGEVPELYQQTLEAQAHKAFWGDEAPDILFYSELSGEAEAPTAGGERFTRSLQLLNCLSTRNYEAAHGLLQALLADAFVMDVRHLQMNKCRMFAMVSNILGVLGNMDTKQDLAFFAALDPYGRLLSVQTVQALREETDAIFHEIIAYNAQKAEDTPAWVDKARAYIGAHYADVALSVGTVADAFGMNVSHFSRTFKKHAGIGILDYIHQTRLEAAKAQLVQGHTVAETAEATGYIDSKALIRAFKRYEGITPGQYKG